MESLPDEVLVGADETEITLPAGPVSSGFSDDDRCIFAVLVKILDEIVALEADVPGAFHRRVDEHALRDVLRDHP